MFFLPHFLLFSILPLSRLQTPFLYISFPFLSFFFCIFLHFLPVVFLIIFQPLPPPPHLLLYVLFLPYFPSPPSSIFLPPLKARMTMTYTSEEKEGGWRRSWRERRRSWRERGRSWRGRERRRRWRRRRINPFVHESFSTPYVQQLQN